MNDDDLKNNEGKVVKEKHLAVYRDGKGVIHTLSSVCTHKQCDVGWNDKDKTWDCPCHGARYAVDGHVINGPAVEPLRPEHFSDKE